MLIMSAAQPAEQGSVSHSPWVNYDHARRLDKSDTPVITVIVLSNNLGTGYRMHLTMKQNGLQIITFRKKCYRLIFCEKHCIQCPGHDCEFGNRHYQHLQMGNWRPTEIK